MAEHFNTLAVLDDPFGQSLRDSHLTAIISKRRLMREFFQKKRHPIEKKIGI